jgi:hypothetical protein
MAGAETARAGRMIFSVGHPELVHFRAAARSGGEPNTPIYPQPLNVERVVRKRGTGVETGVAFEHCRVRL